MTSLTSGITEPKEGTELLVEENSNDKRWPKCPGSELPHGVHKLSLPGPYCTWPESCLSPPWTQQQHNVTSSLLMCEHAAQRLVGEMPSGVLWKNLWSYKAMKSPLSNENLSWSFMLKRWGSETSPVLKTGPDLRLPKGCAVKSIKRY